MKNSKETVQETEILLSSSLINNISFPPFSNSPREKECFSNQIFIDKDNPPLSNEQYYYYYIFIELKKVEDIEDLVK